MLVYAISLSLIMMNHSTISYFVLLIALLVTIYFFLVIMLIYNNKKVLKKKVPKIIPTLTKKIYINISMTFLTPFSIVS